MIRIFPQTPAVPAEFAAFFTAERFIDNLGRNRPHVPVFGGRTAPDCSRRQTTNTPIVAQGFSHQRRTGCVEIPKSVGRNKGNCRLFRMARR